MACLGDFIREERHPLGAAGARDLRLIGVSNEHGLHPSSRDASDDLARYQRIDRDWFAYNPMRVNVGSIGLADDDSKVGFTSPDYVVFSCRPGLEPAYLLHFLKSDYGLEAVSNQCSGAVRKRLYFSGLAEINLPIPGIDQQREVISRLDEAKSAVRFICHENSDRHELPKLKQAILQEAITGRLTAGWRAAQTDVKPASQLLARIRAEKARLVAAKKLRPEKPLPPIPDSGIPFALPEGWEWCRYGDLCEYVTSGSRGWQAYYADAGALFIRAQNIKTDRLLFDDEAFVALPAETEGTRAKVLRNDVLVTITGGNLAKTALVEEGFEEAYVSQHIALTRLVDTRLARWIHQVLTADRGSRAYLLAMSRGDKPGLNLPNVRSVPIPLPPLREQTEIVARVEGLMERCRELEAEIERSRAHAAALLQAVLREAFAPAATAASPVARPAIKPLAYLLQFMPALARAAGGSVSLDRLNRATACLFLPKEDLLPLMEEISGPEAREHFTNFVQPYEDGAFLAAIRTLLKARAFTHDRDASGALTLALTDNLPPIAPDIDADAGYLAPILERVPEKAMTRSAPRIEAARARETLLQLV